MARRPAPKKKAGGGGGGLPPAPPIPADGNWTPEARRAWLRWYARTHGDMIDETQIIADARRDRHHVIWQWGIMPANDTAAAIAHQIMLLRREVRTLRVEYEERSVPAFVRRVENTGYETIEYARTTRTYDEKREILIADIETLRALARRIASLAHGLEVADVLENLTEAVEVLLQRVRPTAHDRPRGSA